MRWIYKLIYLSSLLFITKSFSNNTCDIPEKLDPLKIFDIYKTMNKPKNVKKTIPPSHPCENLYDEICSRDAAKDPTGFVLPSSITRKEKWRFEKQKKDVENIINKWKKLPEKSRLEKEKYIVREYTKKHNFRKKLKPWKDTLSKVKKDTISFLKGLGHSQETINKVKQSFSKIRILEDYNVYPDYIFRSQIYIGRDGYIKVGGVTLDTYTSTRMIYYIMAHEVGHVVSAITGEAKKGLKKCIQSKLPRKNQMNLDVFMEEYEADWLAHQLYLGDLNKQNLSKKGFIDAIDNVAHLFCGYSGTNRGHPDGRTRINFLAAHPIAEKYICEGYNKTSIIKEPIKNAGYCK